MRYYCLLIFTFFICSCSPKLRSNISIKRSSLPDTAYVLVLQAQEYFNNDGTELGMIKAGDNGLSVNCGYFEVIDELKQLAQKNGANVIKIVEDRAPDNFSSCERIKAKIYSVPDNKKHEIEIEWMANRKLTWNDFKAVASSSSNSKIAAETYCGFGYNSKSVKMFNSNKLYVANQFNCYLSWVDTSQTKRKDLLEHEQGHFDISEIYARRLRKRFEAEKINGYNAFGASLIFKEVRDLYTARQTLYEQDTNYGLDGNQQLKWNNIIITELKQLEAYRQ